MKIYAYVRKNLCVTLYTTIWISNDLKTLYRRMLFILRFIFCGTFFTKVYSELKCPAEWNIYTNNKCYWFSDVSATREEAKLECESKGGTLAVINTSSINTFLTTHLSKTTQFWIGLRIVNAAGSQWRWSDGDRLGKQMNWCDDSAPSTACAAARFSSEYPCLTSIPCVNENRFICEKDKMPSPCPFGWIENEVDKTFKCSYVSMDRTNIKDAASFCWQNGGRLMAVHHIRDAVFLRYNRPGPNEKYWLGISPYRWDDGTAYNWHNWDSGGPNVGGHCTVIQRDGIWRNDICSEVLNNFICEKGAVSASTETTLVSTRTTHTLSVGSTSLAATTEQYNLSSPNSVVAIQDGLEDQTLSHVFTSSQSPMVKESEIIAMLEKSKSDGKIVLFITIGIMSVIIVILIVALVAVVIYLRRRLKAKEPTSPQLPETPYEDVSASVNYYNIDTEKPRGNVAEEEKK